MATSNSLNKESHLTSDPSVTKKSRKNSSIGGIRDLFNDAVIKPPDASFGEVAPFPFDDLTARISDNADDFRCISEESDDDDDDDVKINTVSSTSDDQDVSTNSTDRGNSLQVSISEHVQKSSFTVVGVATRVEASDRQPSFGGVAQMFARESELKSSVPTPGWYVVRLNSIVRKRFALDSERLQILPMGSRVYVSEYRPPRRVRIEQPVRGWCSYHSITGEPILEPFGKDDTPPEPAQHTSTKTEDRDDEEEIVYETEKVGWYRVCLNTIVRSTRLLDSERMRILPMGSRVHVIDTVGRRCHIDNPIPGWVSMSSSNGDTILSPLATPRTYDVMHFSPDKALCIIRNMSSYLYNELGWIQGDELFGIIVSFLIDPTKKTTDRQPETQFTTKVAVVEEAKRVPENSNRDATSSNVDTAISDQEPEAQIGGDSLVETDNEEEEPKMRKKIQMLSEQNEYLTQNIIEMTYDRDKWKVECERLEETIAELQKYKNNEETLFALRRENKKIRQELMCWTRRLSKANATLGI